MSNSQITIFYSWQSDLSGSETRNIIQDAIKDAVKLLRDTVDIEADRDTKGEYSSPDIAQTIFSKIDDCDIFIADVSAVYQYETSIENETDWLQMAKFHAHWSKKFYDIIVPYLH